MDHLRCSQVSLKVWTRSRAVLDHGALAWVMLGDPGSVDCMMDCPCTWAVQEVSGVHITCSWAIFLGLFGWLVGWLGRLMDLLDHFHREFLLPSKESLRNILDHFVGGFC